MASIGLDTAIYLSEGSLQIFPVPDPIEGQDSGAMLGQLSLSIEQCAQNSQFIVVDSITDLAGSCPEQNVIAFFSSGRRLTNQGKTVMISIHNYVFNSEMFSGVRSTAHLGSGGSNASLLITSPHMPAMINRSGKPNTCA